MKRTHPLARILKERGGNQRALARELGISPSHLSRILRGIDRLGIDNALRISKALRVPMEDLFK